jgi:hypothetical protein
LPTVISPERYSHLEIGHKTALVNRLLGDIR